MDWHGESIHITVSIGLLHGKQTGNANMLRLLHKADQAMYEARGRNQLVEVFDSQAG
jgi:GGDEF domain-containing protein